MATRRKKKKKSGGRPALVGFLAGTLILAAAAAFFFWPRSHKISLVGLSREDAARRIAEETEKRFGQDPLTDAGEIVSVETGINGPWSVVWQGQGDAALILAEQTVRDLWDGMSPPPSVKVIYPDHSRLGERVRLVASREGRSLVAVLLLAAPAAPVAARPPPTRPPRNPPLNPHPDNPPAAVIPVEPVNPVPGLTTGPPVARRGRIAIIIDDIGNETTVVERLLLIPAPLTFAVMPNSLHGAELARRITAGGAEVMLHLPMEPQDLLDNDPGPGALLLSMSPAQIDSALAAALQKVPMARGLNNHMGSAFTADPTKMRALLEAVGRRGLYFIDSRTCPDSQGARLMRQMGIRGGERRVFLDHVASEAETEARLSELARAAEAGGVPIGIGHPYPETVAALIRLIPRMVAEGFEFVPASEAIK